MCTQRYIWTMGLMDGAGMQNPHRLWQERVHYKDGRCSGRHFWVVRIRPSRVPDMLFRPASLEPFQGYIWTPEPC
jgi:hypothetical protein